MISSPSSHPLTLERVLDESVRGEFAFVNLAIIGQEHLGSGLVLGGAAVAGQPTK